MAIALGGQTSVEWLDAQPEDIHTERIVARWMNRVFELPPLPDIVQNIDLSDPDFKKREKLAAKIGARIFAVALAGISVYCLALTDHAGWYSALTITETATTGAAALIFMTITGAEKFQPSLAELAAQELPDLAQIS